MSQKEWADFQRRHAGEHEIRLTTDDPDDAIWADGIAVDPDTVVAVEAKFVDKPSRSMYEGKVSQPMLDVLLVRFDNEVKRYGKVIRHGDNPVSRLRLVVSTEAGGAYLGARARRLLGDDIDLDVQVRTEGGKQ